MLRLLSFFFFFFFNDTATTEIYTLSLHDALPISFKQGAMITAVIGIVMMPWRLYNDAAAYIFTWLIGYGALLDRKSTRLNSSHLLISYAVFCLEKKKKNYDRYIRPYQHLAQRCRI